MTDVLLLLLLCLSLGGANFVAYTLQYNSADCSGPAGSFRAFNQATCTPSACTPSGFTSQQGFCYAGTLASLANPVSCPGCAYCGSVQFPNGVGNCSNTNGWNFVLFQRLGLCISAGGALWIKAYGCDSFGNVNNYTQYTDAACTQAPQHTQNDGACTENQPICSIPLGLTSPFQDYCSYSGLFGGGGGPGQNNTPTSASIQAGSLLFVAFLIWATM